MTTITPLTASIDEATAIAPDLVTGFESTRDSQTLFHSVIGRAYPDITLRPASLRRGTLTMLFASGDAESLSATAEDLHAAAGLFELTDPDRASVAMTYVVSGAVGRALEDETRDAWLLSVDFQEVAS
ncbi:MULTISPECIES: hypothetical protein [unclassified Frondihabitans]|uniref:hypothetical protein n=1 Tax=unclassified Frondihabitans TaxID=2626248 RepID=UPI000F4EFF93|nr:MULTISPECIES: hypothetical protein [unclassified Frondihabitans]RPE75196.1 hypothetical protein EDF37_2800 [Frondihabitans sp. PhB153]RPF04438.1 hypothetical protein EDF39_2868 [Frondihabitans sp. PhB161]